MSSYSLKGRKITEMKNSKVARTKDGTIMLLSKCAVCDSKKSKLVKEQYASRLLRSLGIKSPSRKTHLVGPLLLYRY